MKNLIVSFAFLLFFNSLSAQEITMFSNFFGTKFYQDDEKLKLSEVNELLKSDTQSNFHLKKANNLAIVGGISALANIGFVVIELTDNKPFENTDNNTVNLIGYLGTFVSTIVLTSLSKSEARKSVLAYNKALEKKTTFKLGPSKKGIGIAVSF